MLKLRDLVLLALVGIAALGIIVYIVDLSGELKGNATTATALKNDPSDCQPDTYANKIDAKGNLGCDKISDKALSSNIPRLDSLENAFGGNVSASNFTGSFAGNFTGDVDGNVSGNAGTSGTANSLANNPSDCDPGKFADSIDAQANLGCSNDGSGLQNLNASNITSGTISDSHLSSNVALLDRNNQTFTGTNNFNAEVKFRDNVSLGSDSNDNIVVNGRLYGYGQDPVTVGHYSNQSGLKVWGTTDLRGDLYLGGWGTPASSTLMNVENTSGNTLFNIDTTNCSSTGSDAGCITIGADSYDSDIYLNGRLYSDSGQVTVGHYSNQSDLKVWGTTYAEGGLQVGASWNQNDLNVYGNTTVYDGDLEVVDGDVYADNDLVVTGYAFGFNKANPFEVGSPTNSTGLNVYGDTNLRNGTVDIFNGNLRLHNNNIRQVNNLNTAGNPGNNAYFNIFHGDLNGNADTATALAADPANCDPSTDGFATGIQADGTADCSTDGSAITVSGSNVNGDISGNSENVNGIVAVLHGGTGADNASDARTNLGLGSMAIQNADGVIITGGTIDGTPIGSNTPAAGTFTMLAGDGSGITNLDASKVTSGTLDDARLTSNVTLQGNTFNGASELVQLNNSGELPAVDGSNLTGLTLSQITDAGTIASQDANNITVTGGTINGTTIGGSTPAAGSFTNVTGTGVVDFSGSTSFKVQVTGAAITDGVTSCTQAGRILFTTTGAHFFGCDGTKWQQLD